MEGLSILIPTYNYCCADLVRALYEQAIQTGIPFEIIVADDGSTDNSTVQANLPINEIPHCHYLIRQKNCGRAIIRNFLTQQATYPWLLFIDSDMVVCRTDFLHKYIEQKGEVTDGGVVIGNTHEHEHLLRYLYEKASEHEHTVEKRSKNPYHDFHTANFMVRRELMIRFPFDERYNHYGYEDVAFGITLKENGISIHHIDNPVSFEVFESNEEFVIKTEEGLRTLYEFRHELHDYSRILRAIDSLPHPVIWFISSCHRLFGAWERDLLVCGHPWLSLFKTYKMGYYLNYAQKQLSIAKNYS